MTASTINNRVFVVFGRDEAAKSGMYAFLRAIGIDPIEFPSARSRTGSAAPYIGQVLDQAFTDAQAVVVLLTPDEVAYLRSELGDHADRETEPAYQPRPNVLFEAGMAFGRHADRTVLVEVGKVREFSDIAGRLTVRVRDDSKWRHELVERLRVAGCEPDTSGEEWLTTPPIGQQATPDPPLGKKHPKSDNRDPRITARYVKYGNSDRLRLTNHGNQDLYEVSVTVPPEVGEGFTVRQKAPIRRLPAGESATLTVMRVYGIRADHFDLGIHAKLDDERTLDTTAFVDLLGA